MAFMLKKKRYKFQVELFLEELNAVTFPSAVLFAKLRLLDGGNFCEISSRYKASLICFLLSKAACFKCDSFRACRVGLSAFPLPAGQRPLERSVLDCWLCGLRSLCWLEPPPKKDPSQSQQRQATY